MSRKINCRPSSETLSVGNVVSAGLRIYRDNFKVYYLEALKGLADFICLMQNGILRKQKLTWRL